MYMIQFSNTPEEYLLDNGAYHCLTCLPKVDVKADGTDQKVEGHATSTALPFGWSMPVGRIHFKESG